MEIVAYQCEHCNKIFKTKKGAANCEVKCNEHLVAKKEAQFTEEAKSAARLELRTSVESVEELCERAKYFHNKYYPTSEILELSMKCVYSRHASNSHSKPIGGVENWRRDENKPTGYPALVGRIFIKHKDGNYKTGIEGSTGVIHTGTGGGGGTAGGGYNLEYSVTLWLSDFPKIEAKIKEILEDVEEFNKEHAVCEDAITSLISSDKSINSLDNKISALEGQVESLKTQINHLLGERYKLKSDIRQPYKVTLRDMLSRIKEKNTFGVVVPYVDLG